MFDDPPFVNRRRCLQLAAATYASSVVSLAFGEKMVSTSALEPCPIQLGKVVWVGEGQSIDTVVREVHEAGLSACQIGVDGLALKDAALLRAALNKYGVDGTAISEHNPGVRIFDFYNGPRTIGIIPLSVRQARIQALKMAADVAHRAEIPSIHTHLGFIPEDPNDPLYAEAVAATKGVAAYCKQLQLTLLCETGEETPITLVRLIEDVGVGNVFVNLDVANLILYGKGNPVDAMDVFGERVRGIHAKDGRFPTDPHKLGEETPIGTGRVDFPLVLKRLKQVGYRGSMLIEREAGDEQQRKQDLLSSKVFLERLLAETYS